MWKKLAIILFSLLLVIIETSFLSQFSNTFIWLRIFLVALLYAAFFIDYETSLLMALSGGWLFDRLSFWPFGLFILTFFVVLLVIFLLTTSLITNRSFYSWMVVVMVGVALFQLFSFLINYALYLVRFQEWAVSWSDFVHLLFFSTLYNAIVAVILFFVIHKKLERIFLIRSHGSI